MCNNNFKFNKIFFLGPLGSNCEVAMQKFVNQFSLSNAKIYPASSIISTIEKLAQDSSPLSCAVVPIENSIEGVVRETLDFLSALNDKSVKILAETVIDVNHCLISNAKSINNVNTIISHPQAISQCKDFLHNSFPDNVNIETATSTSFAVKKLLSLPNNFAAIANAHAAHLYGVPILQEKINDKSDNQTRFILLGRNSTLESSSDKTAIAFSTQNIPGALCKILNILHLHNINISYISSRPSKKVFGEYTFFMDIDGHILNNNINQSINEIIPLTSSINILGSFQKFKF